MRLRNKLLNNILKGFSAATHRAASSPLRDTHTRSVRTRARGTRRGQALVEMALMGTLLGMLLAGAVDLGRAYYTAVVVTNMAGEGAAYAAINPDKDITYPGAGTCSQLSVATPQDIQDRAKLVAKERGLIISPTNATITVTPTCSDRCAGNTITVKVTYQINDLLIPGLLGLRSITINKSASQLITQNAYAASCGGGS